MEDYKKKYEEALENFKKIKAANKDNKELVNFIEYEYPELKESEDEKIGKHLLNWFKDCKWDAVDNGTLKRDDIIAWLEKQGEQKSKKVSIWKHWKDGIAGNGDNVPTYLIKNGSTYSLSSCLGFECDYIELSDLDKLYVEKQGEKNIKMIQWTGDNLKEVVDFTGKSPMFDKWFKTWEEFEAYVHAHNDIFKLFDENGNHYEIPEGAWILKTPDGYNVASKSTYINKLEQKPAWSEEDMEMIDLLIAIFRVSYSDEVYKTNPIHTIDMKSVSSSEIIDWLKHLKDRYAWKPSDEQMKALNYVINLMASSESPTENDYYYNVFKNMRTHLKKLREE